MAKSNGSGISSFNENSNLLENFDTSESINIYLEKSSPIVLSLSNSINALGSVTNIEWYDEKYNKVALNYFKSQVIRETKNGINLKGVQNNLSHNALIIALYKNEIDSLKSETYFLRDEMKQKNDIIKNALNMKQVQVENSIVVP